ncbi:MAG: dolichyl-phosphate beta-glucosyltransferase [Armatimonadota bacterium]
MPDTGSPDCPHPELSIIIPAYNEEERLGPTLDSVIGFADAHGLDCEIIVVDDGSTDATADVAHRRAEDDPRVRLVRNAENRGKGYSVRHGVQEARGRFILFSDADNSTPPEEMPKLLSRLGEEGYDVAIGSRALKESVLEVRQPFYREYMGRTFNLIVRGLARLPFRDTQCGFKAFKAECARRLFARQTVERFSFDVEILYLAVHKFGYRVAEVPVRWINSPRSRVHPIFDSLRMLRDVFRIRAQDRSGAYDR